MFIGIEATHANKKERTGVENYCFYIIQSLKKIIPPSETVVLYSSSPLVGDLSELPPNWQVKVLHWPFRKFWNQFRLSFHFLFHKKPDVYFSPGQLVPLVCPGNTATMVHDSAFMVHPAAYGFLSRIYLRFMNRQIIRKSKLILTSTEFNKKELLQIYGAELAKKIQVIPIAAQPMVNHDKFNPREFGITKKYLISVGRLETKKNTAQIIKAFSILKKSADVQLVLVGKPGVGFCEIEKEIEKCEYKSDIIRPGFVSGEKLSQLMKNASVFVFPSLYEGFGLPVIEAFSLGVPVVASNIEALVEVGGEAAEYVNPADEKELSEKILNILNNPGEEIKYREKGKDRAAMYSWEKTGQKTWEAIANIR